MSVFDLKLTREDLKSINDNITRATYEEVSSLRNVAGPAFHNGLIKYEFETDKWVLPAESFLKINVKYTKVNGDPLVLADGVAPAMNLAPCLFQSAVAKLADKEVSAVKNYLPQIDSLVNRQQQSGAWLRSIGKDINTWSPSQAERMADISADGAHDGFVSVDRDGLGFHANATVAYDSASGVITFVEGVGDNALPADVRDLFPVGSYISVAGRTIKITAAGAGVTQLQGAVGYGDVVAGVAPFSMLIYNKAGSSAPRQAGEFTLIWKPAALSLFRVNHAIPCPRLQLELQPMSRGDLKKAGVESLPGIDLEDYNFEVLDMKLCMRVLTGPAYRDGSYLLDLNVIDCQHLELSQKDNSQKQFDVAPTTRALTAAFQDVRAGKQTGYSLSKFKMYGTGAKVAEAQELKLNRFQVFYAGVSYPEISASAPDMAVGKDFAVDRYYDTLQQTGALFSPGGGETIDEFRERGSYIHFVTPRPGLDRSTRVSVHTGFKNDAEITPTSAGLLLFAHYQQVGEITVSNGKISDVLVLDG